MNEVSKLHPLLQDLKNSCTKEPTNHYLAETNSKAKASVIYLMSTSNLSENRGSSSSIFGQAPDQLSHLCNSLI
ncbi:MAG: hypothetical protein ABW185_25350 [Sedimenticola sp.]